MRISCVLAAVCCSLSWQGGAAIQCYRNLTETEPAQCTRTGEVVYNVQSTVAGLWKGAKDTLQSLSGKQFIDNLGETIKQQIGLDLTSHEKNSAWVQRMMGTIGLDFDLSANCVVSYKRDTGETVDRGCGAAGEVGALGAKLVDYLQGNPFNLMAGSVCFAMPGNSENEVCVCKADGCNLDRNTAKAALGIKEDAESIMCGGKVCPVTNLSRVPGLEHWQGNTACYTKPGQPEQCFPTVGIYDEDAVTAAALISSPQQFAEDSSNYQFYLPSNGGMGKAGAVSVVTCCLLLLCTLWT